MHDGDKENRAPAMPVIFSTERQEEMPGRMKISNDVFGDDTPAPNWSNLPIENGPRRPVAPPLPELIPIVQDEYLSAPMDAIKAFVEENKNNGESEFMEATEEKVDDSQEKEESESQPKETDATAPNAADGRRKRYLLLIWIRSSLTN